MPARAAALWAAVLLLAGACNGSGSGDPSRGESKRSDGIDRETSAGVRVEATMSARQCLRQLDWRVASDGEDREGDATALEVPRDPVYLARVSPEAVVVRVLPRVNRVEWLLDGELLDSMAPVDGWAVLAVPIREATAELSAQMDRNVIVGRDINGEEVARVRLSPAAGLPDLPKNC